MTSKTSTVLGLGGWKLYQVPTSSGSGEVQA